MSETDEPESSIISTLTPPNLPKVTPAFALTSVPVTTVMLEGLVGNQDVFCTLCTYALESFPWRQVLAR